MPAALRALHRVILAGGGIALLAISAREVRVGAAPAPFGAVNGAREIGEVPARVAVWVAREGVNLAKQAVQGALDQIAADLERAAAGSAENGAADPDLAAAAARWRDSTGGAYDPAALRFYRARAARDEIAGEVGYGMVAEGWAADRAAALLAARGFADHRVKVGNSQVAAGSRSGRPWRLAVADPSGAGVLVSGDLPNGATTVLDRDTAPHRLEGCARAGVLDPRSGLPARGVALALASAPRAVDAAALALALPVLGPADGLRLITALPGCGALILDEAGALRAGGTLGVAHGRMTWKK